jgi:hypothetical protein
MKDILLNLSMKCWVSAIHAQGSRLIIVVVQLWAVKICVAAVEALGKKERQDKTQFTTKIDGFLSFIPCWMLMYFNVFFCRCFFESHPVYEQTSGSANFGFWCCVFLTLGGNSIRPDFIKMPIANQFMFHIKQICEITSWIMEIQVFSVGRHTPFASYFLTLPMMDMRNFEPTWGTLARIVTVYIQH